MTERGLGLPAAEPQEVREVTVSPHRPENPVATVLERAALYIEEFGWVQDMAGDTKTGFCALGAIYHADPKWLPVTRTLNTFLGQHVIDFNDTPGRTAAEVTAALREAARRVRNAGEAIPATPSTSSPRMGK